MILSVKKAMEILDRVADKGRISLKELSLQLEMPKSTVCRLAQTLEACGYLYQDAANGDYLLAYKFLRVGHDVLEKTGIRECVWPVMTKLAEKTKETVNLTVLDERKVLYVQKIESSHIHNGIKVGDRAPMYCTAAGKVMLASLSEDKVESILAKCLPFEAFTKKTIVNVQALMQELEECRKRGYAIAKDEIANGVHSIAAVVQSYPGREAAAISIAWPSNRSTSERFTEWGTLIMRACAEISAKLRG
ncbi:IclR family transcriptional regulator [Paradesulfitobacterium aromaticivorans]